MNENLTKETIEFIKTLYPGEYPVPLHAPRFLGKEKENLAECIDSTYVSYVGRFVTEFEEKIKLRTGAAHAVAIVNGTAALHMTLLAMGLKPGDEIITQDLTFAATAAAIRHANAEPAFVDVDRETFGMSPDSLRAYLRANASSDPAGCHDRKTGLHIGAVIPMHTFGHPARIDEIAAICGEYGIPLVEDAAESLGSSYKGRHTGRFGAAAILSFNGNKTITTGGGGMVITDDQRLAERVRYLSTTAKRKHPWEFYHDEVGYNLRLPNVNAAIGCAQMEYLDEILANKRETAETYRAFFRDRGVQFLSEPSGARSNYWLNVLLTDSRQERDAFLERSNGEGVQTRPVWTLMHKLPPYKACARSDLANAEWIEDRAINIPSSYRFH
jgi:aminotransferase in exopolysaccharide biosynthesis